MRAFPARLSLLMVLGATACVVDAGAPDVIAPSDVSTRDAALDVAATPDASIATPLDAASDAVTTDAATDTDATADATTYDAIMVTDAATGTPSVRLVGRIDYGDPAGPRFGWSGGAIEARFTGTGVTLHLNDPGNYFRVAIDGVERATLIAHAGTTSYVLATGLGAGTHTLEVWRRTEAWVGTTQFLGLTFPSGGALLTPPPAPTRRIEVIGDSATCGYGDEGTAPCSFTLATENNYLDYAPITARALDAEIHTIAWSGKGMHRNYDDSLTLTLPDVYDRTLALQSDSTWDFSRWTPDVVVIDLGNNDYGMGDPGPAYTDAYVAFVRRLRTHYPHAYIQLTIGRSMSPIPRIMDAMATLRAGGDTRLGFMMMTAATGTYGGCDNHPNLTAQNEMATSLTAALRTAMHW